MTLPPKDLTIEIVHIAPAHAGGDSVVRFFDASVIALGQTFFSGMHPSLPALPAGASPA